jgi:hypothetical protein
VITFEQVTKQNPDRTVAVGGLNLNVPDGTLTELGRNATGRTGTAEGEGERVMSVIDEALSANATIANDYDRRPREAAGARRSRSSPVHGSPAHRHRADAGSRRLAMST